MEEEFCLRQIVFEIPGRPSVQVTATELGDGTIEFTVVALVEGDSLGDLRGLFFDIADDALPGLSVTGDASVTDYSVDQDNVLDLGQGANVQGLTKDGFDVGVEFGTPGLGKDAIESATFILSNDAGDLTLDDIAHQRFGARVNSTGNQGQGSQKILTEAPAAPDANDDTIDMFEDGASGLDDPSKTPQDVVLDVLANDTDADGDDLIITSIDMQPEHGTVTIAADGKSLIYTPALDYAGVVTFDYCISDGDGGQDHATVTLNIAAVADEPVVTYTVEQGADISEMIITVTATQDDADGSEYIDDIVASVAGGLPAGATLTPMSVNPGDQPGQIVQVFTLVTDPTMSYDFDIEFEATSVETSNGDTEDNSAFVNIDIDFASTTQGVEFNATDQSIWDNGDEFQFVDDRFFGLDTGPFGAETSVNALGVDLYGGIEGDIVLGFQSTLVFEGGEIDATAVYDLTVDTTYNHTTDYLFIDTSSVLTDAFFDTQGPSGSYTLDFIYDVLVRAYIGADAPGFDPAEVDVANLDFDGVFNLIDLESDDLNGSIAFPPPLNFLTAYFAWPDIATSGDYPLPLDASGQSNDFFALEVDIDQLVANLLFGGANPLDPPGIDILIASADLDILDVDVIAGFNFLQDFLLTLGDVSGILEFEDGSSMSFTFGDELLIAEASLIDLGGNGDGLVDFTFTLAPEATLENETSLGIDVEVDVDLLTLDYSFLGLEDTLGPAASFGAVAPVAQIEVYNETFELEFGVELVTFFA